MGKQMHETEGHEQRHGSPYKESIMAQTNRRPEVALLRHRTGIVSRQIKGNMQKGQERYPFCMLWVVVRKPEAIYGGMQSKLADYRCVIVSARSNTSSATSLPSA